MLFSYSHFWVKPDGDIHVLGLSHFAQKELGEVVHIELPQPNTEFNDDEELAVLESTKAATDLTSPFHCSLLETNKALTENPEWINEDPYGKGWLFKVKLKDPHVLEEWMSEVDYTQYIVSN
jgi:glycine cleavage system H protein